jgi:uncharacterized membrane protein YidH (DUF202 family)
LQDRYREHWKNYRLHKSKIRNRKKNKTVLMPAVVAVVVAVVVVVVLLLHPEFLFCRN